jgi:hypothetical protein
MAEYRNLLPGTLDPNAIEDQIFEEIQERFPDWEPADGNLETWIVKSLAFRISELFETTVDVADEIFATYGAFRGVPRYSAERAVAESTWTMVNDSGFTIPAGTQVAVARSGNDLVAFEVIEDVTLPNGETTGTIYLLAVEPGSSGNELTGAAELIDALVFVDSIEIVGESSGGQDEEPIDDYLLRLRDRLQIATETPITPADFQTIARTFHPFVGRAVARDGYDPDTETDENERMISLAVTDADGEPLTSGQKTDVSETLESLREVNFVVHVIDADYTEIDVEVEFVALPGFDPAAVRDAVDAELTGYLSPSQWGRRIPGAGEYSEPIEFTTTVRYLEIASLIDRVPGVDYIDTLGIAKSGDAPGTADLELDGAVPLTRPGTFS